MTVLISGVVGFQCFIPGFARFSESESEFTAHSNSKVAMATLLDALLRT